MNTWEPITELQALIKNRSVTATDLVKRSLKNIEDENKKHNSLISITAKSALGQARKIDERISAGEEPGPLAGIPYIAKDNFLTKGNLTTAASNILSNFVPPFNATAIQKLERAGAILVAKANLDSFAHGGSTENSDYGPTKNPHDPDYVPGGSSGGSAAAVALNLAPFALGTDTGGSIRLPASFTGTVGYKPTYGLVSRFGVIAMASSTDVIGPITKNVEDSAVVLNVLAGRDEHDSTSIERQQDYIELKQDLKGKKFALIKEYMDEGVDESVKQVILGSVKKIIEAGGEVDEISMPGIEKALAVYYIVMPAEVSSNLSRYDGIRFGYSHDEAKSIDDVYDMSRNVGFNDEVKRRIMIGSYVLSSGYYDAYYKQAQKVRTKLINGFDSVLKDYDYLLGPVSPTPAFKIGKNSSDPLKMYLVDIMTVAANLTGVPAISIPVGKQGKLPIGLQIMAAQRKDAELLGVASEVEKLVGYKQ